MWFFILVLTQFFLVTTSFHNLRLQQPNKLSNQNSKSNNFNKLLNSSSNNRNWTSNKNQSLSSKKNLNVSTIESEQRLYLGQVHIQFTLDLLSNILMRESYNPNERLLKSFNYSPLSIQTILMLMHLASSGSTKSQIESTLYLEALFSNERSINNFENFVSDNVTSNTTKVHKIYTQLINNLLNDKQLTDSLSLTSKLFLSKDLKINNVFEQMVNYYYYKPLKQIDFLNQRESFYTINSFISKESKGLIKNFLSIPPSTTAKMVATNAIYFKGNWKYKFDPQDTENDAVFYKTNGQKSVVSMMIGKFPIAYAQSKTLKCSIIELPYKITRLSMFLILPDDVNGLFNLIRDLNANSLTDLIASMRKTNKNGGVNVRIPKFEIDSQLSLMNVLNGLGIRSLFSNNECDLSNMISTNNKNKNSSNISNLTKQKNFNQINTVFNQPNQDSLFPSSVVHVNEFSHKAILKVDETGSVGAGATAIVVERVGMFNGAYFEADHPFLYFLTDKQTGLILFAGVFASPK